MADKPDVFADCVERVLSAIEDGQQMNVVYILMRDLIRASQRELTAEESASLVVLMGIYTDVVRDSFNHQHDDMLSFMSRRGRRRYLAKRPLQHALAQAAWYRGIIRRSTAGSTPKEGTA